MNRNVKILVVLCFMASIVFLTQFSLHAQGRGTSKVADASAASAPADEGKPYMKLYKVSDLIQMPGVGMASAVPPTELFSSLNANPSYPPVSGSSSSDRPEPLRGKPAIGSLVAILKDAVHFDEEVSMQYSDGMLIVTTMADNHRKIEQFLATLRKEFAARQMVTIRASWVLLDDEKAAKTLGAISPLPQALTADVFKAIEADTICQAGIVCVEGQPVHLASGRCETVVTGATPVVADNIGVFQPTVQMVQWGPAIDIKIDPSDDGKSAAIDLDSVLTEPNPTTVKPLQSTAAIHSTSRPSDQGSGLQDIDKLDFTLHAIHTTARIPMGKPTMIGGITVAKGPKGKSVQLILEINAFKQTP